MAFHFSKAISFHLIQVAEQALLLLRFLLSAQIPSSTQMLLVDLIVHCLALGMRSSNGRKIYRLQLRVFLMHDRWVYSK